MNNFTPGDYVCVDITSHSPGAWLADHAIKWFTHSQFCHAFIIVDTKGTIIEATPRKGVNYGNISEYAGMNMIGSTTLLTSAQREGIIESAINDVGKDGYGFLDIAYLGLYLQGRDWSWLENEVLEEKSRTICSQEVSKSGIANGVKDWLCGKSHPNLVTPADLANLAINGSVR